MDLDLLVRDAVETYWADDLQIIGSWEDGAGLCVVYRRTVDLKMILGRRVEFRDGAADGTIEGFARDVAINMAEPVGIQIYRARPDRYGIIWIALPIDFPTPQLPASVVGRVRLLQSD